MLFVVLEQLQKESHACMACAGCQICPASSFANSCEGCTLKGCQLSCESCLANLLPAPANRVAGSRTSFVVPDGGCQVFNFKGKLICIPGSQGSCPLRDCSDSNTSPPTHYTAVILDVNTRSAAHAKCRAHLMAFAHRIHCLTGTLLLESILQ